MGATKRTMERKVVTSGFQLLTSTRQAWLPFLFGSVALGVMGNATFFLLSKLFGASYKAVGGIILGTFLVIIFSAWVLSRIFNRLRPAAPVVGLKSPEPHKGLILLVSNEPTCRKALEWHATTLECCWFVCTTK